MTVTLEKVDESAVEEFVGRVFGSVLGMMDAWSIHVGDKLGLYDALADGSRSRDDLASETGTHWRYVGEWLEQQVTTGFLTVDDPSLAPAERIYSLPAEHAEVLCDRDSLNFLTPFIRLVTAGGMQMESLLEAYRSGGGVSWEQFGDDMRTGQAEMNRPWFLNAIGTDWFPSAPEIQVKLTTRDARIADIGCGEGWSSIAIARSYPGITVDAYDVDEASIAAARVHAEREGVSDRVRFHHVDGAGIEVSDHYDLVTFFECIHDMPDPVSVLETAKRIVKSDGKVVVMDEAVGEAFGQRSDEVERLMYGFSLFVCLPDGMSHEGSVGTGTVMRPSQLKEYAKSAGFGDISVLPIENDLWRFYSLDQ